MSNVSFFKGLNELRAVAAFAVIFHHIELYKKELSYYSVYDIPALEYFISHLGKNAVYLFFVLSGFLITYLLIVEKEETGTINVKKFYGRRIIRIWPLYFLILIIGFLVIPNLYHHYSSFFSGQNLWNEKIENLIYGENLLLFLFFLSNIALRSYGPVIGASQSWSVSVEEQFYFIWPWIVKWFYKVLIYVLVVIIIFIKILNYKIGSFSSYPYLKYIIKTFNVDYMAFGGIMAIIYKNFKTQLSLLTSKLFFFILVLMLICLHLIFEISSVSLAILFSVLIIILIERDKENKIFSNLGRWSYGIYMYHPLVMYISFATVYQLNLKSILLINAVTYLLIFGLTILLSYLSFRFIESYFFSFKRFFIVKKQ